MPLCFRGESSIYSMLLNVFEASLVMPNNYPRDGIFNQHLTTIKDSYSLERQIEFLQFVSSLSYITVLTDWLQLLENINYLKHH